MSGALESKVAIVTGGASGMGLATVRRFLEEGASVVVGDLNAENGRAVLEELSAEGYEGKVRFTVTDVSVEDDVAAMTELAVDAFGRLDVVFNNAGIGGAFGPITELEVDDWDKTFHILVRSIFNSNQSRHFHRGYNIYKANQLSSKARKYLFKVQRKSKDIPVIILRH